MQRWITRNRLSCGVRTPGCRSAGVLWLGESVVALVEGVALVFLVLVVAHQELLSPGSVSLAKVNSVENGVGAL